MADLKPANENPWYVLATLYGEQEGGFDPVLHEKNRTAWNAWAGQALSAEDIVAVAEKAGIAEEELNAWSTMRKEIEDRYLAEMSKRNGSAFVCPTMPSPEKTMKFRETRFVKTINLGRFVMTATADFSQSVFSSEANFYRTTFIDHTVFRGVTFHAAADFHCAALGGDAYFGSVEFKSFAYFESAKFSARSSFAAVTFGDNAVFSSVSFCSSAAFSSSIFNGFVYFVDTEFGAIGLANNCKPSFRDCQFEKPTSFRGAVFRDNYPDLSGAVLHGKTTFTAKAACWPDETAQRFEDKDARETWAEEAKESCAAIRHVLGQQGLPEDEHFFFRREMGFAGQVGSWWARVPYRLFGVLSDYGISIARPVTFLATTFVLPLGAYTAIFENRGGTLLESALSALGLSLASTLKFFGFQRLYFGGLFKDADFWIALLTGTQTVLGYVFLFFLGLGLRQRFRLR